MKLGKMLGTTKMMPKIKMGQLAGVSKKDLGIPSFGTKRRKKTSFKRMLRDV